MDSVLTEPVVSISTSAFTAAFNKAYGSTDAIFDSRAFVVPLDDAPNVFIWRQRDWERNSIQMLARAHFSHKQCDRKKVPELHEILHTKGVNWAALDDAAKNGTFVHADGEAYSYKADYEMLGDYFSKELVKGEVNHDSADRYTQMPMPDKLDFYS